MIASGAVEWVLHEVAGVAPSASGVGPHLFRVAQRLASALAMGARGEPADLALLHALGVDPEDEAPWRGRSRDEHVERLHDLLARVHAAGRLYKVGSAELDAWLEGNAGRKAFEAEMVEVHKLVGALPRFSVKDQPKAIRFALASRSSPAEGMGDPGPIVEKLTKLKEGLAKLPDAELTALVEAAIASCGDLTKARAHVVSVSKVKTDPVYDAAEKALSQAYLAATKAEVETASAEVKKLIVPMTSDETAFSKKYGPVLSRARAHETALSKLGGLVIARKKPSTKGERTPLTNESDAVALDCRTILTQSQGMKP